MRVLVANKFFHVRGGSESVMFQERAWLMEHGHEVADFAMAHPDNLASPQAGHFVPHVDYNAPQPLPSRLRAAAGFVHSPSAVRRITRLARQFRPHVAHLHNIYHQLTPSIIPALKGLGVPVALTLHDYKPFCPAYRMLGRDGRPCSACVGASWTHCLRGGCGGSRAKTALLWIEAAWHALRRSYAGVDAFIAPSRFMADMALRHGIPEHKVRVLPNGVEAERFRPSKAEGEYALFAGRMSPEKGFDVLLDAQSRQDEGRRLLAAGSGPLEDAMRAAGSGVEFLGRVPAADMPGLLDGAAFVVVPSQWYENCSLSVLEAMSMGKPVIATRMGGLPEQVDDGATGLLVEPGDARALAEAMRRLWDDPGLRRAMGAEARRRALDFWSAETHCRGLAAIYESLTNAK